MNDVITKTFCNVVTGLAVCIAVVLNLDWLGIVQLDLIWSFLGKKIDATFITAAFLVSYLIGILFNAYGLLFDKIFGTKICTDTPTDVSTKAFWQTADEHVLAYRDHVWSYYFCYRNLLILLVPIMVGCFGVLWCNGQKAWAIASIILLVTFGVALFVSIKEMLALYFRITKSFP